MGPSLQLSFVVVAALAVSSAVTEANAKRFDCRLFCKETGFHGMLGGCRCSFTLFTAKRASREPYEEEGLNRILSHLLPEYQHLQQQQSLGQQKLVNGNNQNNPKLTDGEYLHDAANEQRDRAASRYATSLPDLLTNGSARNRLGLPRNNLFDSNSSGMVRAFETLRSFRNDNSKRREFEMDLDNGDTTDYLRMPY